MIIFFCGSFTFFFLKKSLRHMKSSTCFYSWFMNGSSPRKKKNISSLALLLLNRHLSCLILSQPFCELLRVKVWNLKKITKFSNQVTSMNNHHNLPKKCLKITYKSINISLSSSFMNNIFIIIVTKTTTQLLIIHFWFIFTNAPSSCHLLWINQSIKSLIIVQC